ncbi:MAG TPA: WecB/TagA/CpsF family glycosyltransferase [Candidatus Acidoferrales bacterium]|nr:WecB/TagA/CpsF family glycosyltransferase [Candidatus Acidoferrales bacterium]
MSPTRHAIILGCRVDAVGCADAVRRIVELAASPDACAHVVTLGTEMVVWAQHDEYFRDIVNAAALSLCDTIGVLAAARLHGVRIPERVTGVELLDPLCGALAREGRSVFLLGAKGDTAQRAAAVLTSSHPALHVAGCHDGYFSGDRDAAVAREIASCHADVLFVAMGSPRQEYWIANHLRATGCRVGIGVGGSFDVLAGNVQRAPKIWRQLNLEWLYRLIREPRRWRRQLALPHFVWLAFRESLTQARGRSGT